jgi:glutamyl-tRNA reductase
MNKLLHAPTHALNHASEEERDALLATLSRLYNINRPE